MSKADKIFVEMCNNILDNGYNNEGQKVRTVWSDGNPAYTISTFGVVNRYDLSEEFPILTLRPVPFEKAIDEILWIWQKKSNNINDLNSKIWDSWADENGSIGKAYGYQLGIKHNYSEGQFDQVDKVLYDIKNNPGSRRIMTNLYNHADLNEMNLAPCAYSMTFSVKNGKLHAMLNQRSNDILTANSWNVSQYAALVHMIAHVSNLKVGELIHVIADAHIYDRHVDIIKEITTRDTFAAPKLWINKDIKDFYDFTVDDIKLIDYKTNAQVKVPVAI